MITKAQVKDIRALATHKGREEQGAYLVEGDKLCREWLNGKKEIIYIVGINEWLKKNQSLIERHPQASILEVSEDELSKISTQKTPNQALLVVRLPNTELPTPVNDWCVVLDQIQDPGNLGTIIRIADWFGIKQVVCSPGCADFYNPKVVASAMGGHLRVQLSVHDLPDFLKSCDMPVYAATLHGIPVNADMQKVPGVLLIGNESKGLSDEVLKFATQEITIPKFGGAESLNAAVATGILLSQLITGK